MSLVDLDLKHMLVTALQDSGRQRLCASWAFASRCWPLIVHEGCETPHGSARAWRSPVRRPQKMWLTALP